MIIELITKLQNKTNLTYDEVSQVMTDILNGKTNDQENLDFLKHLTEKGETDDELLGMLDKMQEFFSHLPSLLILDEIVHLQLDSLYAEQP